MKKALLSLAALLLALATMTAPMTAQTENPLCPPSGGTCS